MHIQDKRKTCFSVDNNGIYFKKFHIANIASEASYVYFKMNLFEFSRQKSTLNSTDAFFARKSIKKFFVLKKFDREQSELRVFQNQLIWIFVAKINIKFYKCIFLRENFYFKRIEWWAKRAKGISKSTYLNFRAKN